MEYGKMIDEYAPINDNIYKLFINYFNNPILVKMKNENNTSMYACKTICFLNRDCRFIIVFTPLDSNIVGKEVELKDLNWICLMTRTLPSDTYKIDTSHGYIPAQKGPLTAKIKRINITPPEPKAPRGASVYDCEEFPIIVTLLHTQQKNEVSYRDRGTVIAALEEWETIITFAN